ncbi:hypothetical protein NC651_021890 [Populus alba x Populus x berolinensis]|nr:hypothetical protein NC651_021890 [Populus alba x Populus x berolinensis]
MIAVIVGTRLCRHRTSSYASITDMTNVAVSKFNSIEASRSLDVEGKGLGLATCGFNNSNPNDLKQK